MSRSVRSRRSLFSIVACPFAGAALALVACVVPTQEDPIDPAMSSDDVELGDAPNPELDECPVTALESRESFQFDGTLDIDDLVLGSCSDQPAPESRLQWTVPTFGIYEIAVEADDFEPHLVLLDGGCDTAEIACRKVGTGTSGGAGSRIELAEGQTLLIVVDADTAEASGSFTLTTEYLGLPWE